MMAEHGAGHLGSLREFRDGPRARTQLPRQVKVGGSGGTPQCVAGPARSASDRMDQGTAVHPSPWLEPFKP